METKELRKMENEKAQALAHAQVRETYYGNVEREFNRQVREAARKHDFADVEALFLDYGGWLGMRPDALPAEKPAKVEWEYVPRTWEVPA